MPKDFVGFRKFENFLGLEIFAYLLLKGGDLLKFNAVYM